jgi:hypothetical protein
MRLLGPVRSWSILPDMPRCPLALLGGCWGAVAAAAAVVVAVVLVVVRWETRLVPWVPGRARGIRGGVDRLEEKDRQEEDCLRNRGSREGRGGLCLLLLPLRRRLRLCLVGQHRRLAARRLFWQGQPCPVLGEAVVVLAAPVEVVVAGRRA